MCDVRWMAEGGDGGCFRAKTALGINWREAARARAVSALSRQKGSRYGGHGRGGKGEMYSYLFICFPFSFRY